VVCRVAEIQGESERYRENGIMDRDNAFYAARTLAIHQIALFASESVSNIRQRAVLCAQMHKLLDGTCFPVNSRALLECPKNVANLHAYVRETKSKPLLLSHEF
jgi:hypothetical protein